MQGALVIHERVVTPAFKLYGDDIDSKIDTIQLKATEALAEGSAQVPLV